jgi:diadenosine tetraphosphate (Ap4A) HIT family hydrolase
LPTERIVHANELAVAVRDAYPVSKGHTLIIPRRHVASFFAITPQERTAMLDLLEHARARLDTELQPDGYNVGINDGAAAGQTITHLHVHLIPRYAGDRADPRGGVRGIFPDRADYWSRQPGGER